MKRKLFSFEFPKKSFLSIETWEGLISGKSCLWFPLLGNENIEIFHWLIEKILSRWHWDFKHSSFNQSMMAELATSPLSRLQRCPREETNPSRFQRLSFNSNVPWNSSLLHVQRSNWSKNIFHPHTHTTDVWHWMLRNFQYFITTTRLQRIST